MTRPNFIIFMPDQLRADAVGAFGNPLAHTPNLDRFAASGTLFDQAFAQHSVCSQSRVSMFTGWYPHVAGHRTITNLIKPWEPNVFRSLKESGYHVAWLGPRGDTFAPGATELSVDEYGFWTAPSVHSFGSVEEDPDDLWARLFYRGRRGDEAALDYDEAVVRSAVDWLRHPPGGPWVLFLPLLFPHCPFTVEEPWFSLIDRSAMPGPAVREPGEGGHEPRFMAAIRERYGTGRATLAHWQELKATYYGMVARVDDQFGRVMRAAEDAGLHDRTVTFFFTDHGEYLGDHGLIEKWPAGLNDCLVREPLMIGGGGLPAGGRSAALVEMVDLVPTLLELAGVEAGYTHFGRSLLPLLTDPGRPHRTHVFSEGGFTLDEEPLLEQAPFPYDLKAALQHEDTALVGKATAVRTHEWTYVYRLYEPDELYHRPSDPSELRNLAADPDHAGRVAELRGELTRWLMATSDVVPWEPDPRFPPVELTSVEEQARARRIAG
ncbi:sulfatase-like hydrolase/transferase [Actinomadura sp. WAC 06369]|uniref:sulfatase-like hydrolase/transferase n=1 Tax=Actinomadura sp. WAC 06369 TaxID=2203193 RepID=UPI000F7ADEC5|nr:sulfatase-like hydrolase/transferase [Actinomadura sp. WAC 06369]RSN64330.1 sulfatase [Actinomadura sp. WAC 06369]